MMIPTPRFIGILINVMITALVSSGIESALSDEMLG